MKKLKEFKWTIYGFFLGVLIYLITLFSLDKSASPFYFCPDFTILRDDQFLVQCSLELSKVFIFIGAITVLGFIIDMIKLRKK